MYRLPPFKGEAGQKGYGIGGIFKGFGKNVYTCCEEGSFEFGQTGYLEWSSSIR